MLNNTSINFKDDSPKSNLLFNNFKEFKVEENEYSV